MLNVNRQMLIVVLGSPGSGKGTQVEKLIKKFNLPVIATGDLVREWRKKAAAGDPLGIEIKKRYDAGEPQPDEIIIEAVSQKLKTLDLSGGVIFDAFPLSLGQAAGLEKIREGFDLPAPLVLDIKVSEEEVLNRLSKRKFCLVCLEPYRPGTKEYEENKCRRGHHLEIRPDDKPEVVKRRYQEYQTRLATVFEYYQQKDQLVEINGEQSVEDVWQEVLKNIKT